MLCHYLQASDKEFNVSDTQYVADDSDCVADSPGVQDTLVEVVLNIYLTARPSTPLQVYETRLVPRTTWHTSAVNSEVVFAFTQWFKTASSGDTLEMTLSDKSVLGLRRSDVAYYVLQPRLVNPT